MHFPRMPIEEESPEQLGYDKIKFNLTESSVRDRTLIDLGGLSDLTLAYTDHVGHPGLRDLIAARAGGGQGIVLADNYGKVTPFHLGACLTERPRRPLSLLVSATIG